METNLHFIWGKLENTKQAYSDLNRETELEEMDLLLDPAHLTDTPLDIKGQLRLKEIWKKSHTRLERDLHRDQVASSIKSTRIAQAEEESYGSYFGRKGMKQRSGVWQLDMLAEDCFIPKVEKSGKLKLFPIS